MPLQNVAALFVAVRCYRLFHSQIAAILLGHDLWQSVCPSEMRSVIAMSVDRSLKGGGSLQRHRNVLKRSERIAKLEADDKWSEERAGVFPKPQPRRVPRSQRRAQRQLRLQPPPQLRPPRVARSNHGVGRARIFCHRFLWLRPFGSSSLADRLYHAGLLFVAKYRPSECVARWITVW
jgi:small basic protein (TIGR04137 family)